MSHLEEAKKNSLMSMLIKEVYDTVTFGGNPESLGPNNFIAFDPVGINLTSDAFDFATKGLFGAPPAAKVMIDPSTGKPILDADGKPKLDTELNNALLSQSKFRPYLQMEEFSSLVDAINKGVPPMIPGKNGRQITIFNDSSKRISKVYDSVLHWSVVMDTPLDKKVEEKLDKMRNKLFKIKKVKNPDFDEAMPVDDTNQPELFHTFVSPMYAKYLELQLKYDTVVQANNEIKNSAAQGDPEAIATVSTDGKNMKKREDMALKAWQSLGYKESVERIQNYLSEIESKHLLVIKNRLQSEFRNSQRTKVLDYTNYSPSVPISAKALDEAKNWPEISVYEGKSSSEYVKTVHNWGVSGGYDAFIWGVKASTNGSTEKVKQKFDFSNVSLSFKVGKVRVERGWFSQDFIESKYWKFMDDINNKLDFEIVSDGKGNGAMPSIITELIIATDVKIDFSQNESSYQSLKTHVAAGGGAKYLFFDFNANYSYDNQEVRSEAKWSGKKLTSPGIYIIGYKCTIVPQSPNPDPNITAWIDGKS